MNKTNNFVANLNLQGGDIVYNDFDIDENLSFEEQKYSYKEDILQITFGDRFILDVGWRREFNPAGHFVIKVIQDKDWLNPVSKIKCKTLSKLKKAIESSASLIHDQLKIKDLPYRDVEYEEFD